MTLANRYNNAGLSTQWQRHAEKEQNSSQDNTTDWRDYPVSCYTSVGDDFSGWYAMSDKEQCTDFCFWGLDPSSNYSHDYDANNTADPHETTKTLTGSTWLCLRDVLKDDMTWRDALPLAQDQSKTSVLPFPYLRCSRGPGEKLDSLGQVWVKSSIFWALLLTGLTCLLILEVLYFYFYRRRTEAKRICGEFRSPFRKYAQRAEMEEGECLTNINSIGAEASHESTQDQESESSKGKLHLDVKNEIAGYQLIGEGSENKPPSLVGPLEVEEERIESTRESIQPPARIGQQNTATKSSNWPRSKKCCTFICILFLNLGLALVFFTSILSLLEIDSRHYFSSLWTQQLTPACTQSDHICSAANKNIDRPSSPSSMNFTPFSYIIASDSQLDWYAGESAYLGRKNYPLPCSSSDSCSQCTQKFGTYTNQQMKHAMERLIKDRTIQNTMMTEGLEKIPIPNTLIMNGDLTAYFHHREFEKYSSVYHKVKGVTQYFPSLGNHDYDHYDGATFSGDEWVGPHQCNAMHSIAYLKSGFCSGIPNFDPQRITRYDSESLAYSWEEGSYHFCHLHYFPTYENAKIGIASSLQWLQRDLTLASEQNLTSVLFVHSAGSLPRVMKKLLVGKRVAAIFAGHQHRCLGRKCFGISSLNVEEVEKRNNGTDQIKKCFPASLPMCGTNVNGDELSLFFLEDSSPDWILPNISFYKAQPLPSISHNRCPWQTRPKLFINDTDNTLLCKGYELVKPNFEILDNYESQSIMGKGQSIPIFWSGSASFETFLGADFHHDRIIVNVITAEAGYEGKRYIDVHTIPNAVYPFHNKTDLGDVVIHI